MREVVVRTAPIASIYTANVVAALATRAVREKKDHLTAARYYRSIYLRMPLGGAFLDSRAYLNVPALARLHQTRGLMAAGRLDGALAEWRRHHAYLPGDTLLAIDLIRALDRAKRKDDADRVFATTHFVQRQALDEFPRSPFVRNRQAWLTARTGRQLDAGLDSARKAVELAPTVPGYLETLAEVHFQRGEKKEAIDAMRRCLKLAPDDRYYAAQLRRFEAGDKDAALPSREVEARKKG